MVERNKFVPHVMVLAGACVHGKGHVYFMDEKAKVIVAYYLKTVAKADAKIVSSCY